MTGHIKEPALLPIHLNRHMSATIEISVNLPAETDNEGRCRDFLSVNFEANTHPAFNQRGAFADQAFVRSHAANSSTLSTHSNGVSVINKSRGCAP